MTSEWGAAEHDIRIGGSRAWDQDGRQQGMTSEQGVQHRDPLCSKELQTLAKTWSHPEGIGNCFYGLIQDLNHKLSAAGWLLLCLLLC